MPHYKNGTPAAVGDRLKFVTSEYNPASNKSEKFVREGIVASISPGQQTCNANVYYPVLRVYNLGTPDEVRVIESVATWVTLGDCLKVEPEPE